MAEESADLPVAPKVTYSSSVKLRRDSIAKASPGNIEDLAVPHYRRASIGSCHDYCKYGQKHTFEVMEKHHVANRRASIGSKPPKKLSMDKLRGSVNSEPQISSTFDTNEKEMPTKVADSPKQGRSEVPVTKKKTSVVKLKTIIHKKSHTSGLPQIIRQGNSSISAKLVGTSSEPTLGPVRDSSELIVEPGETSKSIAEQPVETSLKSTSEEVETSSESIMDPVEIPSISMVEPMECSSKSKSTPEPVESSSILTMEPMVTSSEPIMDPVGIPSISIVEPVECSSKATPELVETSSKIIVEPVESSSILMVEPMVTSSESIMEPVGTSSISIEKLVVSSSKSCEEYAEAASKPTAEPVEALSKPIAKNEDVSSKSTVKKLGALPKSTPKKVGASPKSTAQKVEASSKSTAQKVETSSKLSIKKLEATSKSTAKKKITAKKVETSPKSADKEEMPMKSTALKVVMPMKATAKVVTSSKSTARLGISSKSVVKKVVTSPKSTVKDVESSPTSNYMVRTSSKPTLLKAKQMKLSGKHVAPLKSNSITVNSVSSMNPSEGSNGQSNSELKMVKRAATLKVAARKLTTPSRASLPSKSSLNNNGAVSIGARKHKSLKIASPLKNQLKTRKYEHKEPANDAVEEKTLYVIKTESVNKTFPTDRDVGDNVEFSPQSPPPPEFSSSSQEGKESEYAINEGKEDSFSVNLESKFMKNGESLEAKDIGEPRMVGTVSSEDKARPMSTLNFRSESLGRSFKRRYESGIDRMGTPAVLEKVVLRRQCAHGKQDGRGLFNNVIEETANKLAEIRKSKVKALVGAFETVISLQESRPTLKTVSS